MKKQITIINQDSGYLMIDIANAFADAGHEVSLFTGRLLERNTPLHPSIKLQRVLHYKRNNIPARLLTWTGAFFQMLILIWFHHRKAHLFIVSNPPMAPLLPLFCSNPYSLLIYDVYVEKPRDFALLGKYSPLVFLWEKAHKRIFKKASHIFTLTDGMRETLERHSGGKPVKVVPIWTDNEFLKPLAKSENPFVKQHGLEDKFVVLYSGNIGASSGVEHLVKAAAQVNYPKVQFLIIGEGIKKEIIKKKIQELNLTNCLLLPWQETKVLPYSLASADLAVVSLGGSAAKRSIPSKLYNYLSVGSPILCLADAASDLAKMITKEGLGKSFEPTQYEEIAAYIENLSKNGIEHKSLKEKSLKASLNYTKENAKKIIFN